MADSEETYNIPIPLQNIGCQDLLSEHSSCSHSGWLRKKRVSLFSWPHVYVLLHEGCLYYFKHEKAKRPAGKFSLYGYNSVFRAGEIPPKEATWVFKIVHTHGDFRSYFFSASSEQEMKAWMVKVKQEMLKANGKLLYGKKFPKGEKPEDDNKFYQEVETNIYDDAAKFKVTKEYSQQYSVKRATDESDDDDDSSVDMEKLDRRPPVPLPGDLSDSSDSSDQRPPMPPPRPTEGPAAVFPPKPSFKPPEIPDFSEIFPTEPRVHKTVREQDRGRRSPSPQLPRDRKLVDQLNTKFKQRHEEPKVPLHKAQLKRRPSYEETDIPGSISPSPQRKNNPPFTTHVRVEPGSSTGSDKSDELSGDEYWSAIYYDEGDKQKANDIIQAIGEEGVYLVRPEASGTGKVLVVFADDTPRKYRIQQERGEYFLAREGYRHDQLEELLRFYYEEELPTVHVKLKGPYKLHSKFNELNL